jgi:hypothetical protein
VEKVNSAAAFHALFFACADASSSLERDGSRLNRLRIPKSDRFNMLAGKEASMDGATVFE